MTWDDWIDLHARAYGHRDDSDLAMLDLWAQQFAADGWTADDLAAATRWVLTHVEVKFRSDTLAALIARLRAVREQQIGRQDDAPQHQGCKLCGWTGWVPVPDPKAINRGAWAVMLALCVCPLGRLRRGQGDQRPSVELWHLHMPDWHTRMTAHDQAVAAALKADGATIDNDHRLGPIFAKILARQSEPPNDE